MIVTVTPLKEPLGGGEVLVWEARIDGKPATRSFLWDHAVGMLVKNHPDLFGVTFDHRRLAP